MVDGYVWYNNTWKSLGLRLFPGQAFTGFIQTNSTYSVTGTVINQNYSGTNYNSTVVRTVDPVDVTDFSLMTVEFEITACYDNTRFGVRYGLSPTALGLTNANPAAEWTVALPAVGQFLGVRPRQIVNIDISSVTGEMFMVLISAFATIRTYSIVLS